MRSAMLVMTRGPQPGRQFVLGDQLMIGRGSTPDISIVDPALSRQHCLVRRVGTQYEIEDLGSTNGVQVNGVPLSSPTRLAEGDEIILGRVVFCYSTADEATVPVTGGASDGSSDVAQTILEAPGEMQQAAGQLSVGESLLARFSNTLQSADPLRLLPGLLRELLACMPCYQRVFVLRYEPPRDALALVIGSQTQSDLGERLDFDLLRTIIDRGQSVCVDQVAEDRRPLLQKIQKTMALTCVAGLPLRVDGVKLGVLYLDGAQEQLQPQPGESQLLESIGGKFARWLHGTAEMEAQPKPSQEDEDMQCARKIQHSLLPDNPPRLEGMELLDFHLAAGALDLSSARYLSLADGKWAIVMAQCRTGEVSGALALGMLAVLLDTFAGQDLGAAQIATHLDASLGPHFRDNLQVELLLLVLDPESGALETVDAGHLPPLIRRQQGQVESFGLVGSGALGAVGDQVFESVRSTLLPGEVMVIANAGVFDAKNDLGEMFGMGRVVQAMQGKKKARKVLNELTTSLRLHLAGATPRHDQNIVCISRL